jgi:hypothetical protein
MYHFNHLLYNCFFMMTPREHYAFYLSIVWDLDTRHPLIHNTELYGDSDFDPDSDEDGPDGDEEDLEASASENSCSSHVYLQDVQYFFICYIIVCYSHVCFAG